MRLHRVMSQTVCYQRPGASGVTGLMQTHPGASRMHDPELGTNGGVYSKTPALPDRQAQTGSPFVPDAR